MTIKNKAITANVAVFPPEQVQEFVFEQEREKAEAHAAQWGRESALEKALAHHKINGGMLTPAQLIDHAKIFHTYITGETK
jgi:hypothetical protein